MDVIRDVDPLCVAVGSVTGNVTLIAAEQSHYRTVTFCAHSHATTSVFWPSIRSVVTCGRDSERKGVFMVKLWQINDSLSPEEAPLACFTRKTSITSVYFPDPTLLFVGDRNGTVCLYRINVSGGGTDMQLIKDFGRVHSKQRVCSIFNWSEEEIASIGRNGQLVRYRLPGQRPGKEAVECEMVSSSRLCKKIDFLEKLERTSAKNGQEEVTFALGFYSTSFVIFNVETSAPLINISCGGSHRAWDGVVYVPNESK